MKSMLIYWATEITRIAAAKLGVSGSFRSNRARLGAARNLRRAPAMALFLCSPAGANVSGQAISVCGNVESL